MVVLLPIKMQANILHETLIYLFQLNVMKQANKIYKVAGWASVRRTEGEPIWDLVSRWLKSLNQSLTIKADQPTLIGLADNLGIS